MAGGGYGQWQVGAVVADLYDVVDVVRTGGMGLVYRVRHRGWNVDLAVKVPRPDLVSTPSGLANFTAEAESWVHLGLHPHTVNCVYVQTLDGLPRVFAEWVDGGTLAAWVRDGLLYEGGPDVALGRILDIAVQVAWGLEHAHRNRLIHQDVKPANVMVTAEGVAKVTDFGLAKARADAGESSVVPPGASMLVGYGGMTPAYCSPEQADAAAGSGVGRLTRATDVWSWAVCVLEMFTGSPPTGYGQAAGAVLEARVETGSPEPERIPAVPAELVDVLRRCFAVDPEQRRMRMSDLAEQLTGIYRSARGVAYPRVLPAPSRLLADGLSNQALSLFDIGQVEQAEQLLDRALEVDPHHLPALYNRGLHRWRQGRITDSELVSELTAVRGNPEAPGLGALLLGQVHVERGDIAQAQAVLTQAAEQAGDDPDVAAGRARAEQQPAAELVRTLPGHAKGVKCVALSSNGRIAATGDGSCSIRIWDVATGSCLHRWERRLRAGHLDELTLSSDGRVALWRDNHTAGVWVWSPGTGRRPREITLPKGRGVYAAALSGDGTVASLSGSDGAVSVWDTSTCRYLYSLLPAETARGSSSEIVVRKVLMGPSGRAVTYDAQRGQVRMWDVRAGSSVGALDGCRSLCSISPDGCTVLVKSVGLAEELWDLDTGHARRVDIPSSVSMFELPIDDAGRIAVASSRHGEVQIWDLTTSRCLVTLLRSDVMTDSRPVTVSGNGRLVVAGGLEEHAFLLEVPDPGPPAHWSFTRPRSFAELTTAEQAVVVAIRRADELRAADSPSAAADALRAARRVAGHERSPELLRRWRRLGPAGRRTSLRAAWRIRRIPGRGAWRETAEDSIAFSATAGGMLRVWDLDTGSLRHEMIGHQGRLAAVAISPDGAHGYTAGDDGYLRMWDLRSGTRTAELRTTLQSVEITRNGLVVGEDRMTGNLTVHDLPAGRRRWSWRPTGRSDSASLHRIGLAAEDLLAVTTNSDGTGQVWDLVAGRCVLMLTPRKGGISGITVDEKRGRVFTLDRQAGIRVWDLATGHRDRLLSCSGRQLNTLPIVVSPDGKLVLFCGDGPDVRVWDVQSGRCVRVLEGHSSFVQDVVVSGDGAAAVTSSYDGTARVWDMATGRCLRVLEHAGNMGVSASDDLHRVMTQVGDSDEMQLWELDWEYDFTSAPTPEPAPAPRPPGRWSRLLGR